MRSKTRYQPPAQRNASLRVKTVSTDQQLIPDSDQLSETSLRSNTHCRPSASRSTKLKTTCFVETLLQGVKAFMVKPWCAQICGQGHPQPTFPKKRKKFNPPTFPQKRKNPPARKKEENKKEKTPNSVFKLSVNPVADDKLSHPVV